jgi:hypothetical protein
MNNTDRITAATIHPQLRSISSIRVSPRGMRGLRNSVHIHANADFPPNDAAAAETRISSAPTGFNAPARQDRIPAVRYGAKSAGVRAGHDLLHLSLRTDATRTSTEAQTIRST